MKETELMIGDYLYWGKDKIVKVQMLRKYGDNFGVDAIYNDSVNLYFCTDNDDIYSYDIDELKPIPLTPDILEKNDFVANKHVYPYPYYEHINEENKLKIGFAFPQGDKTSYKEPWVYIDSEYAFVEHLPCIYVHELQHALRLTGIKKELKL